jgi:lipopolysaccharide assembly outer membrane protein LptD (OstA)
LRRAARDKLFPEEGAGLHEKVCFDIFFAALGLAQQNGGTRRGDIDATANKQWREGNVFHLSGSVVIETDGFTLRASEADFNQTSHEIRARGNVSIRLK